MPKFNFRIAAGTLKILRRIALAVTLMLFFAGAGVFLTLRYSVLPEIERYHLEITSAVSRSVGLAVEIGKIEADWFGLSPHLRLTDIRILDKQQRTTLALQQVDIVVSWRTLLAGEIRLASLEIDQPDLMVKRDAQGQLQISGVTLGGESSDNNFSNMLLSQSRIVIRDAHISWLDEQQAKPLLVFDSVNLIIENGWNRHRFAIRAIPPAELSSPLDVRGDFYGSSFDDMQGWRGEVFTRLEYANFPAWKTWLSLPDAFKQGRGALRGWLGVEQGKISQITADLALENVQARLGDDLPPLDISVLSGRIGWHDVAHGFEISSRKLSFRLHNNFELKPTDVFFSLSNAQELQSSSGELRANLLELDGLGKLLEFVPLDRKIKNQIAEFSPLGLISNMQAKWQFDADKQLHYRLKARFAGLALQRSGQIPGFSGLSGEVDGNETSGSLSIKSRNLVVDAPHVMPERLTLDTVSVQANWHENSDGFEIGLRSVALSNADIEGTAYGSYQAVAGSPGKMDLNVHLSRAPVSHVGRYIPLFALGGEARTWINKALLAGQVNDFNFRLKGDLNDFPYADNKMGIFKVHARAKGVALEYDPEWPRIHNGNVEFILHGKELKVAAVSAMTAGVSLKNVNVKIADVLKQDLLLSIHGEAEAENAHALGFINSSPVRGYLGGFTDDMVAAGKGRLNIKLDIPLSGNLSTKVAGTYRFVDSEVELEKNLPTLRKVNGDLMFTESGVSTRDFTAQILGGQAQMAIDSDESGAINVKLGGKANFDLLREANPSPLLRKLHGEPSWNVEIGIKDKLSKILVTTNLAGLRSDLPAPFAKRAGELVPVRFEMNDLSAERDSIALQYGSLVNANLIRIKDKEGEWAIRRGIVNFGNVPQKADRDGLWIIGTLPPVSLDGWGGLPAAEGDGAPIVVKGADVVIQKLSAYGNQFNDLHIKANSRYGGLLAQLSSREVNGDLRWYTRDNGRLVVRLKNLDLAMAEREAAREDQAETSAQQHTTGIVELPEIDLSIEKLSLKGRQLGKLELLAQQDGQTYLLDYLRLLNSDGALSLDGKWKMSEEGAQTQISLKFDFSNAGNILARVGYPNSIKNGSGRMEGSFDWAGTPAMFSKAGLNGTLSLDTNKGQFMQIEPGIGKLLSILSLQALPKRITLDFEDVFSKGFEFDSIKGSAEIRQGVMVTDNLKIEGSAAKVSMAGKMDLVHETQDMKVRIVPTVGNSVALISALMVNPVAGAGVYLAGKILDDPLGQLASFEYNISGSWMDPKVEKSGETKSAK